MYIRQNKKFNKLIFKSIFIIFSCVCLFNYLINPYNIFHNAFIAKKLGLYRIKDKQDERCTKFISLKLNNKKINTIFYGTSRVDYAIDSEYYTNKSGLISENMGIMGLKAEEILDNIEKIILIHPEIKNIYVALDFSTFGQKYVYNRNKDKIDSKNDMTKYLTLSEIGASLLSLKTTGDSISCIIRNLSGKKRRMWNYNGTRTVYVNEKVEKDFTSTLKDYSNVYKTYKLNMEVFKILEQLKYIASEKNINIQFFIMPTHITDLYLIYKYSYNDYKEWKRNLVKYVKVIYDFNYPNSYVEEPISPAMKYFFESSHSTHYIGNVVLDTLHTRGGGGNINSPYGHQLTPENIEKFIYEDEQNLKNFINTHKDLIKWEEGVL